MSETTIAINNVNLISILSSPNFYGSEDAFLRELLQNAVDACMTRAALEWSWGTEFLELETAQAMKSVRTATYQPRIRIVYNSATQRLMVEDNGIGLNTDDVEKYVARIGESYYTSNDFQLQQLDYEPIGHFGIGLLSCFMVARALLIESKKDKSVNTAWNMMDKESLDAVMAKWFEGKAEIEYVSSNREESGTRVTLILQPKYAMKMSIQKLAGLVDHYMLYQPFPVEVVCDEKQIVLEQRNAIMDNSFGDILGIISIPIYDEIMEGIIWLYNSKHREMIGASCVYQQGFLIAEGDHALDLKPAWIRDMTYHIHLKRQFLTLRASRDSVAEDEHLKELRGIIGRKVVSYFANNPIGLGQYLASGRQMVLTEYEEEMQLLERAVTVDIYLKGQEIALPIETIIQGFSGKAIRIAFLPKALFQYFRSNYIAEFRKFLEENKLIVFERNRDIFCQFMAPYRKAQHYVISELPGIIYDDMVADFRLRKSVIPYRNHYMLRPAGFDRDDVFCMVTNYSESELELMLNQDHRLYKLIQPVMYEPKIHRMLAVIMENIKQRIINYSNKWTKIVDFGGSFVDDWRTDAMPTVSAVWCLERNFTESLNEYIETTLSIREQNNYGLATFRFRRSDFISWWFVPDH